MYHKYEYNENIFNQIDTPEKAYWLGFLYADGNNLLTTKKTKTCQWRISLTLQKRDRKHVIKFRNFVCPSKVKKVKTRKDGAAMLTISRKKISQDLFNLGVVPRKSLTISFPDESIVPHKFQMYFIQGLFDGDGSVSLLTTTKTPCACLDFSGSITLIKKLKKVIKDKTNIDFGYKERKYINKIAVIYLKGNDKVLKFLEWLYKDTTYVLPRKYKKYLEVKKVKEKVIENKSSMYRGVYMKRGFPHAQIQIGEKVYRLGRFDTEMSAAKAYNTKAVELFGDRAKLNGFAAN